MGAYVATRSLEHLLSSQVLVPLLGGECAKGPEDHIQRGQPEQDQEPLPARYDARREIDEQTQVAEAAFEPGLPVAFMCILKLKYDLIFKN